MLYRRPTTVTEVTECYSIVVSQVNLILGLLIVLGSSALNAFGLNLTKLDHVSSSDPLPTIYRQLLHVNHSD